MENNAYDIIEEYTDGLDIEEVQVSEKNLRVYLFAKRTVDIIFSLLGIVILAPIFIIVMLLIKKEDPTGPVVFKHVRVGKSGKEFSCLKFRSMFVNAQEMLLTLSDEQLAEYHETYKIKDDPRITKIGKFIRKTSIDELPQLINIIKGDMSLVGPRPVVEEELEFYGDHQDVYKSVRPGLTGYWQVHGRSDTTYDERVAMDVDYVKNRRFSKDIKLIFQTVTVLFGDDNAY